jgi:hypothetical protein
MTWSRASVRSTSPSPVSRPPLVSSERVRIAGRYSFALERHRHIGAGVVEGAEPARHLAAAATAARVRARGFVDADQRHAHEERIGIAARHILRVEPPGVDQDLPGGVGGHGLEVAVPRRLVGEVGEQGLQRAVEFDAAAIHPLGAGRRHGVAEQLVARAGREARQRAGAVEVAARLAEREAGAVGRVGDGPGVAAVGVEAPSRRRAPTGRAGAAEHLGPGRHIHPADARRDVGTVVAQVVERDGPREHGRREERVAAADRDLVELDRLAVLGRGVRNGVGRHAPPVEPVEPAGPARHVQRHASGGVRTA